MNRKQQRTMEQQYGSATGMSLAVKYARLSVLEVEQRELMWHARRFPERRVACVVQARAWNRLIRNLRFRIRQMETALLESSREAS